MAQKDENSDHGIKTVETYVSGLGRDYEIVSRNQNAASTRLVWFVAIAGFALINVGSLADTIVDVPLTRLLKALLVFPWAFVGFAGVVAHYLLGELSAKDNEYYMMKQHSIRSWLANTRATPRTQEVLKILNVDDTDKEVLARKKAVEKLSPIVNRWEKATFFALIFSFIWSVLYPVIILILANCTS